jgi:hypothetical protein
MFAAVSLGLSAVVVARRLRGSGSLAPVIRCQLLNHVLHAESSQYIGLHRRDRVIEFIRSKIKSANRSHGSLAWWRIDEPKDRIRDFLRVRSVCGTE